MRKKINLLAQPAKKVPKNVRENLAKYSLSKNYDEAKREWELINVITVTEQGFVESCELCNHKPLKANYIIKNIYTEKTLKVGSICILRFLLINGAQSITENYNIFFHMRETILARKALQNLLAKILEKPNIKDVRRFRNISKKILGTLNIKEISPESWEKYLNVVFGEKIRPLEAINVVRTTLFNPRQFKFKITIDTHEEEGHWAHRIKSKPKNILHGVGRATKTIMEKKPGEE